ncbi:unnamed protein product [marine sediment metagenome]|uniref:Uncharacterized protein n=1 Tax=marine sediment metagenome TaxID=412755 RepID=X0X215_9ZZZZ
MIDKFNATEKVRLIRLLFGKIFRAGSVDDLEAASFTHESGKVVFEPFSNSKGLRGFTDKSSGLLLLEQNPGKGTWCADLANQGIECAWVMKQGSFLSFVFRWNRDIHIVRTDPKNRDKVEDVVESIMNGTTTETITL